MFLRILDGIYYYTCITDRGVLGLFTMSYCLKEHMAKSHAKAITTYLDYQK